MARHRERSRRRWAWTSGNVLCPLWMHRPNSSAEPAALISIYERASSPDVGCSSPQRCVAERTSTNGWRAPCAVASHSIDPSAALQACSGCAGASALAYACSWTSRFRMHPQRVWVKSRGAGEKWRCAMRATRCWEANVSDSDAVARALQRMKAHHTCDHTLRTFACDEQDSKRPAARGL